jgi:predicted AAA+ superfamily ATPase
VEDYVEEMAYGGIRLPDAVRRDPIRVMSLLRALARNVGTEASVATLVRDSAALGVGLGEETAADYLHALMRLMVYEPAPAWSPVLRSRARVRLKPKHFLADPALATALLAAGVDELRRDLKTFGFLFESLAVRDLRVYAAQLGADVYHYRDSNNLEVDAIMLRISGSGHCGLGLSGHR